MASPVPVAVVAAGVCDRGTERHVRQLAVGLDQSLFDVHVVWCGPGQPAGDAIPGVTSTAAFPVDALGRTDAFRQARAFGRWCQARRIALVHTADRAANIFGLPAAFMAGVPVRVGSRRDAGTSASPALTALQRAAYACAQVVVANSASAAERLRQERVASHCIQVVPDAIDVEAAAERDPGAPIRRIVALAPADGLQACAPLLDAAPLVLRRCAEAEFVLVGDTGRASELQRRAELRGLGERVRFASALDGGLLERADLVVVPGCDAAAPDDVLRAMAAGRTVIAVRGGSLDERIDHQRSGVLVARCDARTLAYALLDLVHWPEHAAKLGRTARAVVGARHAADRMVSAFETVYLTALDARDPEAAVASEMLAS
jgi:glycosyltransferase involved in cell wall biosynthesis